MKVLSAILAIGMAFSVTACSEKPDTPVTPQSKADSTGSATSAEATDAALDISKEVVLKTYLLGDEGGIYADEMIDAMNAYSKEKINATIEPAMVSWGDWTTKFPAILASGEKYDMIYASSWCFLNTEAPKGAYYPLDDLLPVYAPKTWADMPKEAWEHATINGKIYLVPATQQSYTTHAPIIRADLRKKYNVPEIKSMDDFGVYLQAIKDNEPSMLPFAAHPDAMPNYIFCYENDWGRPLTSDAGEIVYKLDDDKLFSVCATPEYETFVKRQRSWFEKGYWSKTILSNKTDAREAFKNGTSASYIGNMINANADYGVALQSEEAKAAGWEMEYAEIEGSTKIQGDLYNNNGTALGRNCPNPERAVMWLELAHQDQDFYDLIFYGIKGKIYDLTEDGKLYVPEGTNIADIGGKNVGMGVGDKKFERARTTDWDFITNLKNEYEKKAVTPAIGAFVFDQAPVNAEIAAINNVCVQYKTPLDWGVVDPAEGLPVLLAKLKEAGIDKVISEFQSQLDKRAK